MMTTYSSDNLIPDGLDFILSHFEPPSWPRTISTHITEGKQIKINNREEALAWFKAGKYLDCRISAYPSREDWAVKLLGQAPDFVFIDEDGSNFKSRESLDRAHKRTLKTIKEKLNGAHPTVLWSGKGYHTLQPIKAFILESESVFTSFDNPSMKFLRFAEPYLSNEKADPYHSKSLSFRNCMLRIPGSYHSKCVQQSGGNTDSSTEVRIIQKWDGKRPAINWLLRNFRRYLIQEKIDLLIEKRKAERRVGNTRSRYATNSTLASIHNNDIIPWIETLLQVGLPDHRKYALSLIAVPYLVNVKRLPYDEAFLTVRNWLDRCSSVQKLDSSFNYRIKYAFKTSQKNGFRPIRLEKLKQHNTDLYGMIEKI